MAGHSHWNNIQRRKGAVDAKRAKVWGKVAKKIMVAAKKGPDPRENLSLRYVVDEAKSVNMPKDTIQKAIDKGAGLLGTDDFEDVVYEGYGPGGVALIVEALTDNRARTAPNLRTAFERAGGSLGTQGSVSYQFSKVGVLSVDRAKIDEDKLMELALDAGADDVRTEEGAPVFEVVTPVGAFARVRDALDAARVPVEDAVLTYLPGTTVEPSADAQAKLAKLLDFLDDDDDVQNVYHNAALP